ncbi:pali-domain-containing protein [Panus rudis PR-1116 ss-1]|nr:pali-domain-containing protein [Panus rudis PR-1116 ss-1]
MPKGCLLGFLDDTYQVGHLSNRPKYHGLGGKHARPCTEEVPVPVWARTTEREAPVTADVIAEQGVQRKDVSRVSTLMKILLASPVGHGRKRATILLALVTFSAPILKSIYFLQASLDQEGIKGNIVFGTLGYCLELQSNGTTCSKPSIGYQLDINGLVGNDLPIKIPSVIVKWITYALFLHAVALILAAISALFGLLAHVREFSMTCCSTCVSGFAAAIAMLAFIFDLAFFFLAKARINAIKGAHASIGIGLWLTLAAWIMLFFAGCFYGFGRCCISRRPKGEDRARTKPTVDDDYADRVRLDAVKAEADRKARQAKGELGLPAFQEYEQTQPLTKVDHEEYVDDNGHILPYHNTGSSASVAPGANYQSSHAGYAQAPAGSRAVDDYYNTRPSQGTNSYPPQPRRQATDTSASTYSYNAPQAPVPTIPPPPSASPSYGAVATAVAGAAGTAAASSYLSPGAATGNYAHSQYPSNASAAAYGHTAGGTTYHSAASHQQYGSSYSAYDPYAAAPQQNSAFNSDTYNNTGYLSNPLANASTAAAAYTPATPASTMSPPYGASHQPERSYTLGGDNYATYNSTPSQQLTQHQDFDPYAAYYPSPPTAPSPGANRSPAPITTQANSPPMPSPSYGGHIATPTSPGGYAQTQTQAQSQQSPRGPRPPSGGYEQPQYEDSPPMYDAATAQPPGAWGAKH